MTDDTPDLTDSEPAEAAPMGDAGRDEPTADTAPPGQYGIGPFTVREVSIIGTWLIGFVVSFFSLSLVGFDSVWTSGLLWILTIGVPSVAVFLLILRRLSPDGIRRVGSLGIDQFASVAFSVSAMLWVQMMWETVAFAISGGPFVRSWVMWVEVVVMLALVVLTVFAPVLPALRDDFVNRREIPAHRNARPVRAVIARPTPPPPVVVDEPAADGPAPEAGPGDGTPATDEADAHEQAAARPDTGQANTGQSATAPTGQPTAAAPTGPFWALSPVERDVHDEHGAPIFAVGPTAWALVIEDRGGVFVIQHEDGRVGFLHDVTGVTRG